MIQERLSNRNFRSPQTPRPLNMYDVELTAKKYLVLYVHNKD